MTQQGAPMQKRSIYSRFSHALLVSVYAATTFISPVFAADPRAGVTANKATIGGDAIVRKGDSDVGNSRFLTISKGKSLVIDLPRDAKDVLITDSKIADGVIRSARRAYVFGKDVGTTSVFFFDEAGQQIAVFDVHVHRDVATLNNTMKRVLKEGNVRADAMGDNIVLTGTIDTSSNARTAVEMAQQMAGIGGKVINKMQIIAEEQVHLKVIIAEMKRDIVKQLGVDMSGAWQVGTAVLTGTHAPAFIGSTAAGAGSFGPGWDFTKVGGINKLNAMIKALEQNGLSKTLAEPTLTAISGESASFTAGGEVPYAGSRDRDGNVQVNYKPYGVSLNFTPVVLSEGRISLKVKTEVSDIANGNTVGGSNAFSFVKRSADTTVEIPSGGSMVIAGLFQDNARQGLASVPGMKELPILGALFRSRDFETGQTELTIVVTPYIVRPSARQNIALPTDNFELPNDASIGLLGRFNKIYGVAQEDPNTSGKSTVSKSEPAPKKSWGYIID